MKAAVCFENGDPDSPRDEDVADPIGGPSRWDGPSLLGHRGRMSMVGYARRDSMKADASMSMARNHSPSGVFLGAGIGAEPVGVVIRRLIDDATRGERQVVTGKTSPHSRAAVAHAYIGGRQAVGRVALNT